VPIVVPGNWIPALPPPVTVGKLPVPPLTQNTWKLELPDVQPFPAPMIVGVVAVNVCVVKQAVSEASAGVTHTTANPITKARALLFNVLEYFIIFVLSPTHC